MNVKTNKTGYPCHVTIYGRLLIVIILHSGLCFANSSVVNKQVATVKPPPPPPPPPPPSVLSAQQLMVRQQYRQAKAQVTVVLKNDPRNIHAIYTLAAIEQTRILDYESYTIEGKAFQALADSLKRVIEARLPYLRGADSVQALFYCANLVGGSGVMQAKRGEWIDGAKSAVTAVNLYRQVKKLDPRHLGADFGIGTFDYYLGSAFKWIPFVTGASAERGFASIERSLAAPFPFSHAARNTYCWILIDRKQFARADSIAHKALVELPGNSMFLRIRALIALWTGDYKSALNFAEKLRNVSQKRSPINWSDLITSYYVTVEAHEKQGRRASAHSAATTALELPMPETYKSVPHVKEHLKYLNGVKTKYKPK